MTASLPERRASLVAALGFARLRWHEPLPPVSLALSRWMNSWTGLGAVVVGMAAQGSNVELKEFPEGWRADFYPIGLTRLTVPVLSRCDP